MRIKKIAVLEEVLYADPNSHWKVMRFNDGEDFVATGYKMKPLIGRTYQLCGDWVDYNGQKQLKLRNGKKRKKVRGMRLVKDEIV